MKKDLSTQHVLIIGAARQGVALARFMCENGAQVTITDGRTAKDLETSIDQLKDLSIRWVLGAHPLNLLDESDMVCISGGVPLDIPIIKAAKERNILLTNDSQIFLEWVKSPIVGITGSAGKTTTTALMRDIANKARTPGQNVWVGGNIGNPLITQVDEIEKDDLVILELSSFQLEIMTKSPHIAVITNITPNHLDRHGTLAAYTSAKANILKYQTAGDFAILNREDQGSFGLKDQVNGQLITFGLNPLSQKENGSFVKNEKMWMMYNEVVTEVCTLEDLPLRGKHNIYNVLAAVAISTVLDLSTSKVRQAIKEFPGVAHRMQLVRNWNGIKWFDDSIATAPERTLAAVEAFDEPIVLLLGGKDKNLPWDKLLHLVNDKVDHVILFGHAATVIEQYIHQMNFHPRKFTLTKCEHLQDAVVEAKRIAEPGDVVLLSPGGTSYDEFTDFEERGEMFKSWVYQL